MLEVHHKGIGVGHVALDLDVELDGQDREEYDAQQVFEGKGQVAQAGEGRGHPDPEGAPPGSPRVVALDGSTESLEDVECGELEVNILLSDVSEQGHEHLTEILVLIDRRVVLVNLDTLKQELPDVFFGVGRQVPNELHVAVGLYRARLIRTIIRVTPLQLLGQLLFGNNRL